MISILGPGFTWGFFVGFVACFLFLVALSQWIKKHEKELLTRGQPCDPETSYQFLHVVSVERQGSTEYWFDSRDGKFLAQGCSRDEITARLAQRFRDHAFVVNGNELLVGPWFTPVILEQDINELLPLPEDSNTETPNH